MEDAPCLLDVISDFDALEEFLAPFENGGNDSSSTQFPLEFLQQGNEVSSSNLVLPPAISTNPGDSQAKVPSHYVQPKTVAPSLGLHGTPGQTVTALSNSQQGLAVGGINIASPGPLQQLQTSSPATVHASQPSSPAVTLLPLNRNANTPIGTPSPAPVSVQPQLQQQQQQPQQLQQPHQQLQLLQQIQSQHLAGVQQSLQPAGVAPRPAQLPVIQPATQKTILPAPGNVKAVNIGGQVQIQQPQNVLQAGQINLQGAVFQTSNGNKIVLQGQPIVGGAGQLNVASLQGVPQLQLQSNNTMIGNLAHHQQQQQQQQQPGNVVNNVTQLDSMAATQSLQAPPNVSIMNLNVINPKKKKVPTATLR